MCTLINSGAELACPVCDGRHGHPTLIASRLVDGILAYSGDGRPRKSDGRAHVAIVDQGALGTAVSSYLARAAGVGHILIIDDDVVELSNLQRQTLFEENDVGRSKADAACEHLGKINSDISITPSRERLTEDNIPTLLGGADIVIDASNNFEVRKIIMAAAYRAVFRGYTAELCKVKA